MDASENAVTLVMRTDPDDRGNMLTWKSTCSMLRTSQTLLKDLGRSTVVQLAVDGNWSEAMQAKNALADALGQLFPVLEGLELPLALLEGLTSGTGLVPTIVDAGATAGGLGGAAGAVPNITGAALGAVADVLDV